MFYLITGLALGLASALTPGPLMALVITETLKGNWENGLAVSVSPLITDVFIITITVFILSNLSIEVLAIISIFGGFYLFYLAFENYRHKELKPVSKGKSLLKGILTNLLNPNPYIFWFTVGGPLLIRSWQLSIISSTFFLLSFYISFIGLKFIMTLAVSKTKTFNEELFRKLVKVGSLAFLLVGVIFIVEGITKLV